MEENTNTTTQHTEKEKTEKPPQTETKKHTKSKQPGGVQWSDSFTIRAYQRGSANRTKWREKGDAEEGIMMSSAVSILRLLGEETAKWGGEAAGGK